MKRAVYFCCLMIFSGVLFFSAGTSSLAQSEEQTSLGDISNKTQKNTMVGLTVSGLRMTSDEFREVFGKGGAVTGMEASHIFLLNKNNLLGLSFEIKSFSKTGRSTITSRSSFFSMIPLTLTGKYMINISNFCPYLGAGADLVFYKENSQIGNAAGGKVGFHIESGIYYYPSIFKFIKIKAALRISRIVADENNIKVNLGGVEFGMGILYCFDIYN
jgi:outer membrane protein W